MSQNRNTNVTQTFIVDTIGDNTFSACTGVYTNYIASCFNDLIYIDTTHDYGRTREEILIAYENLKEGQYISGHDYNTHGVSSAILSVFEYPDIKIYLDSSWIIKKTSETKLK